MDPPPETRQRVARLTHAERGLRTRQQMINDLQNIGLRGVSRLPVAVVREEHQNRFGDHA
jgi:hypothetical protein